MIDYIQKIKYGLSKYNPLPKIKLLNLMPEIYNEKIQLDNKFDLSNKYHLHMDEFLIKFMKEKFHYNKIFKRNLEQTIMGITEYSQEDIRIESMRIFCGIHLAQPLHMHVLDCFLVLLKNLPISFFKLFEEFEISNYILISIDGCIEIFNTKFPHYFISLESFDKIIKATKIFKNEIQMDEFSIDYKKDIFFLMRFYQKSSLYIEGLLKLFKSGTKAEESMNVISEQMILTNKEYGLSLIDCIDILKRNFKHSDNNVYLEKFFDFFLDKYVVKIKALEFVQISLDSFRNIYTELEKKIDFIWTKTDYEKKGLIFFKEFEKILVELLGSTENLWKFTEYFEYYFLFFYYLFLI